MRSFTTSFFIKRTKKMLNGECPIYCRLIKDRQRAEFATKVSIEETFWSSATEKAVGKSRRAYKVNNRLEEIRDQIGKFGQTEHRIFHIVCITNLNVWGAKK